MWTAFDAPTIRVIRGDDGHVRHAEAQIDDSVVMLGVMPGGAAAHVHIYVPDADAALERAVAAGGTLIKPATEEGDGDRRGGVRTPEGTTWWLSTTLTPQ